MRVHLNVQSDISATGRRSDTAIANVTTTLLQKEKRRGGRISVHPVIEGISKLFCPFSGGIEGNVYNSVHGRIPGRIRKRS